MQRREGKEGKWMEDEEENETLKRCPDHGTIIIPSLMYRWCPERAKQHIQGFGSAVFSAAVTVFCCQLVKQSQLCHCINSISDLLPQTTPPSSLASTVLPRPLSLVVPPPPPHDKLTCSPPLSLPFLSALKLQTGDKPELRISTVFHLIY